jgi:hypothetical protein
LSVVYVADPDFWAPMFTFTEQIRTPVADATVGGHRYGAFVHDWRVLPAVTWLAQMERRELAEELTVADLTPMAPRLALSQPDFAAAVKQAYRGYRQRDLLARSALLQSRLVGPDRSVDELRRVLDAAVAALGADSREGRALTVTYLKGVPTQEAAANRLGLPFSTYRRHLATALDRATDWLWDLELYGDRPAVGAEAGSRPWT